MIKLDSMSDRSIRWYALILLAVAVLLLYGRVLGHGFIAFDDGGYVSQNEFVKRGLSWRGFQWAWTTLALANYHPLTWLSYQLDVSLFGLRPGWMAIENVLIHTVNSWLLFRILIGLGFQRHTAILGSLVFALHPSNVESVAWISQRKTQLAALTCFSAMAYYINCLNNKKKFNFFYIILFFVLSLFAKPSAIVLPLVLIVFDNYFLIKNTNNEFIGFKHVLKSNIDFILKKWTLFLSIVPLSWLFFISQKAGGAVVSMQNMPLFHRIHNIFNAIVNYLIDFAGGGIYVLFYPFQEIFPLHVMLSFISIILIITLFCMYTWRKTPGLWMGWCLFLLFLLPVIGIVQIGSQSRADRYLYFPMIGLIMLLATILETLGRQVSSASRGALVLACSIWTLFLGIRAVPIAKNWKSTFILINHTIQNVGDDPMVVSILASALAQNGQWDKAIPLLTQVVYQQPNNWRMSLNLALGYFRTGRRDDAVALAEAIRTKDPANERALWHLAWFYRDTNRPELYTRRWIEYEARARQLGFDPQPLPAGDRQRKEQDPNADKTPAAGGS